MTLQLIGGLGVTFLVLILVFIMAATSVRIVSPYQKGVVERLGRYHHTAQPGMNVIMPFIDTLRKVDMREQVVDVQPQEVITKDNVVVTVDAIVYYEATDPVKLAYNVADFYSAATKLAQTNLRNVVGETELDEALTSREMINSKLRMVLDDATDKWGVRVVRVEIKRIDPPADVTAAMHRQMKAEREKRANILEAEGFRQSRILNAEGEAEAVKRVADAQRYKVEVEAAGQGECRHHGLFRHLERQPGQPRDRPAVPGHTQTGGQRPGVQGFHPLRSDRHPGRLGRHPRSAQGGHGQRVGRQPCAQRRANACHRRRRRRRLYVRQSAARFAVRWPAVQFTPWRCRDHVNDLTRETVSGIFPLESSGSCGMELSMTVATWDSNDAVHQMARIG